MRGKLRLLAIVAVILFAVVSLAWWLHGQNVAVLSPAGEIAHKERNLMLFAILLSAIVVLPVFGLTIFIVWKYRESNKRPKKYQPDWDHSHLFEGLWWGIPSVIILILSVVAWQSSHTLDPFRPLASKTAVLHIQVVSLDWKWLFIYPQQHVATVNIVELPTNTPVEFDITSDTVMNSFWIPNLGGQIYSMPGMVTRLNLMASKTGSYPGSSANISGSGFAKMSFMAQSVPMPVFHKWLSDILQTAPTLTEPTYNRLSQPGTSTMRYYIDVRPNLFDDIVMKYMMPEMSAPASEEQHMHTGGAMTMPMGGMNM
jgi:cytochrome o ubiquinol oxidase subunit 2